MTSQSHGTVSAPLWGVARRYHLGGPALIAFWLVLWALFLGTVGRPLELAADAAAHTVAGTSSESVASRR